MRGPVAPVSPGTSRAAMSPMALTLLSALWTVLLAFGMVFAVLTGVAVAHLLATAAVLAVGWFAADAAIVCLRSFRSASARRVEIPAPERLAAHVLPRRASPSLRRRVGFARDLGFVPERPPPRRETLERRDRPGRWQQLEVAPQVRVAVQQRVREEAPLE